MAKPVSGALGYNPVADRPTVQLRSGTKKLLTEDDGGGGTSPTPSYSEIPDSFHVDNDNFEGTPDVWPPGYEIWTDAAGGKDVYLASSLALAPGVPTVGIYMDDSTPAAGNSATKIRYNVNSRRPSWLHLQNPTEFGVNHRFAFLKKLATPLGANFTVIVRFMSFDTSSAGSDIESGSFSFALYADASGKPHQGGVQRVGIQARTESDGRFAVGMIGDPGPGRIVGHLGEIRAIPEYLMLRRVNNYTLTLYAGSQHSWAMIGTPTGGFNAPWQWWGFSHCARSDGSSGVTVIGVDWIRRYDTAEFIL